MLNYQYHNRYNQVSMTRFSPFRGLKYNLQKVHSIDDLICPPFDLISSSLKKELENKSPQNAVWLEGTSALNDESSNKYIDSKETFNKWLKDGVIVRDSLPVYHLIKFTYGLNRNTFSVTGLIGMLRVEDYSLNNIIGHENTYLPIVNDRIQLLKTTGIQFSPILAAFKNSSTAIPEIIQRILLTPPDFHVNIPESEFSDSDHIDIWTISHQDDINSIQNTLSDSKIYIADGHHRYQAALKIQNMPHPTFESKHIMTVLMDLEDPGLQILPYHRIIDNVNSEFIGMLHDKLLSISGDYSDSSLDGIPKDDIPHLIETETDSIHTICTIDTGKLRTYTIDINKIPTSSGPLANSDAWILQTQVVDPILMSYPDCELRYTHDLYQATRDDMIFDDTYAKSVGVFFGSFPKEAFEQVALSDTNMPPKSTFFYPKIPTGLIFHPINMGN